MSEQASTKLQLYDYLGLKYEVFTADKVVATMVVTPRSMQPWGLLHGGISGLIAESIASSGAAKAAGQRVAGLSLQVNHLRAVPVGHRIIATAMPTQKGRTIHVWEVRIEMEPPREGGQRADNEESVGDEGRSVVAAHGGWAHEHRKLAAICTLVLGVNLGKPVPPRDPRTGKVLEDDGDQKTPPAENNSLRSRL